LQSTLALDQRRAAQVVSVEIEQIESELDEAIRLPFRQLPAQCLEVGQPSIAEYRCFAIDDEVMSREDFDRVRDRWKWSVQL
jgi:hypothetical protein